MGRILRLSRSSSFGCLLIVAAAPAAHAAVAFVPPEWARPTSAAEAGERLSTYQRWDAFASQTANTPDVAWFNPNGTPNAFDANHPASGSIVTSTGNLYAGSGIVRINTVVPGYGADDAVATRFLLQIGTSANALFDTDGLWTASTPANPTESDFSRLLVNGQRVDALPSFSYRRLHFQQGSSATSFAFERAISFELPGSADLYTIEFAAARGSTSITEIAVDTLTVVPEPGALGVVGFGAAALLLRRRRA